ncbi:shikimate dehydrogenase [Salinarimonas soli]|uniref:Shikimate dehydrogenase (NADP(+)) n=1 Tax=Salinarimonas soli TaxID=1638099 RepID=A0A5B2VFG1_9HYPH|nr:shikimate dehydrogenase [Salinarimonas soli]KAA2237861.1 shikimate dehydrogenase [Salinarimonas soli]
MRKAFVVGHPIRHSRSPLIHGHWLREHGIAGSYERIDVAPADFAAFLRGFPGEGFVGGNVTIPHKEAAFQAVDHATERARRLGAVNTLWTADGRLHGDNTDGLGFVGSLDEAAGGSWEAATRTALVLGAGGAARAVAAGLVGRGVPRILVANRSPERAADVAALAPGRLEVIPWEDREAALRDVDLLVNTTSLGMAGQPSLDLALDGLPVSAMVADIVYVPLETPLLAAARRRGLRAVDGLGMLLHQAVPGFERWFGVRPVVTRALRDLIVADIEGRS